MSIVLPIIFFSVIMGLWVRRMTPLHWGALIAWITLVIVYNLFKTHST